MNRGRIRCYKCREYVHFANDCYNTVTDDSDGYESDRVAIQLITVEGRNKWQFWCNKATQGPRLFKLIKGKNATTSLLPQTKKGGWVRFVNKIRYIPNKERECLTEDQARHVYKMVETEIIINIETMEQDIEDDRMHRK